MVPEIWGVAGIIFCLSGPVLPFYPVIDPGNQNFKKMKKTPEDIVTLQMCNINDSHVMCGFWDMECNGQMFLSFRSVFTLSLP